MRYRIVIACPGSTQNYARAVQVPCTPDTQPYVLTSQPGMQLRAYLQRESDYPQSPKQRGLNKDVKEPAGRVDNLFVMTCPLNYLLCTPKQLS